MNLEIRKLSNEALAEKLNATVREERHLTVAVLHLLREVERRELFAQLGFSSLFTYCVEHLKYSESAAQRRIVAMRALHALPELEEKIETGKLSLSVVALAESTLRQCAKREHRKVDANERRAVFTDVEGLSRRKAEDTLIRKFDLALPKVESVERALSHGGVRIVLEFSSEEMSAIEDLRRLSSRPQSVKEMILSLIRAESAKRKRQNGEAPLLRTAKSAGAVLNKATFAGSTSAGGIQANIAQPTKASVRAKISTQTKRQVWMRANGQCEHQRSTGSRCSSTRMLEFDHVVPRSYGGSDDSTNLRLLCRAHHRLVTTEVFGVAKMQQFRPTLNSER